MTRCARIEPSGFVITLEHEAARGATRCWVRRDRRGLVGWRRPSVVSGSCTMARTAVRQSLDAVEGMARSASSPMTSKRVRYATAPNSAATPMPPNSRRSTSVRCTKAFSPREADPPLWDAESGHNRRLPASVGSSSPGNPQAAIRAESHASKQPVDRQARQKTDPKACRPVGFRIDVVTLLLARGGALDPHQTCALRHRGFAACKAFTGRCQADFVSDQRCFRFEKRAKASPPLVLSMTTPISVFNRAERRSKLNEPTKNRARSTA